MHELIIEGGTLVDGTGAPARTADVAVDAGRITEVGRPQGGATRTIDADGLLVTPGWVDVHTHYDAEVLLSPGLGESVRHGTTSIILGNCSLSTVYSGADDCGAKSSVTSGDRVAVSTAQP